MRRILIGLVMAVAVLPLGAQQTPPPGALGQAVRRPPPPTGPVQRLPDGTVDMTGLWVGGGSEQDLEQQGGLKPGEIPVLPWVKDHMAKLVITSDPSSYCLPMGIPRMAPYPWRFVQDPPYKRATHLYILNEGNIHTYRQIFMDGRKHPAELDPTWFGHSIGSYDGKDTLVIDTVGFNDKFWFDRQGTPHTEQLHTVERWTRVNEGTLRNEVTIDDPGAYSKPFVTTWTARLAAPGDEIMENICQENNQFGTAGGHTNPFNR